MEAVVKSANGKTAEKREEKLENEKTAEAEKEDKLANDYSDHNHQASAVEDIEKLPIGKTDEVEEVVKLANSKTAERKKKNLLMQILTIKLHQLDLLHIYCLY